MQIFENLSDDQLALLGCGAALLFSGTLMSLSYYSGRNGQYRDNLPKLPNVNTVLHPKPAGNETNVSHAAHRPDKAA